MQTKYGFPIAVVALLLILTSPGHATSNDGVVRGIAEATYTAGANEAPAAATEEAKKLALRAFIEKTLGGYVVRRAQVQNTHLMENYVDFWSGAHVRIDSVLVGRYWTKEEGAVIAYRAHFSAQVSIATSEIRRLKDVIASIEREVAETLKAELLAAERKTREEGTEITPAIDPSVLRVELERRVILARIEAEKLRIERVTAEEERRSQEEQARQAREEQLARERQQIAERLAALRDSVVAMRSGIQTPVSSLDSPLATLRGMRRIDAQIKEIKEAYREELRQAILMVSQSVNPKFEAASGAQKSEFETATEFRARAAKMWQDAKREQTARSKEASARIDSAIDRTNTEEFPLFVSVFKRLSAQQFTLIWQDLELDIGAYNPRFNTYPVSIRTKEPMDGLVVFVSAQIPIPREEAQVFHQHAEHDILRPELVGNFQTTQFFHVTAAYVIDDATNKQYDLFSSKLVDLGNGIVYDSKTRLLWPKNADLFKREMTWADAEKACASLEIAGLSGWRLPTDRELGRMYTVAHNQEPHPFINVAGNGRYGFLSSFLGGVLFFIFPDRSSWLSEDYWQSRKLVWPVREGKQ